MRTSLLALGLSALVAMPALAQSSGPAEKQSLVQAIQTGGRPEVNRAIERVRYLGAPRDLMGAIERILLGAEPSARRNAAYAMTVLARPAQAPILIKALEDEDPVVREHACVALGKTRTRAAVGPLGQLTKDSSPVVRREAVRALGLIGQKAGVQPALALLADPVLETRLAAIGALGELKDARAIPRLLPLLKDESDTTLLAAARSLCMLGNAEGRTVAEMLLTSSEPTERRDGVRLIEDVRARWVTDALVGRLEDGDLKVRIASALALARQGDGRGVQWLVLASDRADAEEKLQLETAIEQTGLTPEDRKKIRAQARPQP